MTSTSRTYFEDMYRDDADPWGFESSSYEHRKYALTMASLPHQHYGAVYEPGCSIGVLSELLSPRCDRLLATDIIPDALGRAASRLRRFSHVVVEERAIPEGWPKEKFDLIVLSEIAYYFDEMDLSHLISLALESTDPGAHIVGVHWRGATDYPLTGDHAHEIFDSVGGLHRIVHHVEPAFLLDVWERT